MTGDEAQAIIDDIQANIIAMYKQARGNTNVLEPLITVTIAADGSKRVTGHDRMLFLNQIKPTSKLHDVLTPRPPDHFWCLILEQSGRIHTHEVKFTPLTAPGASGMN